jgi:UPF0716 protein FxsA
MLMRLVLLFTLLPLIELYLLIKVGSHLGAGFTILLVLVTGVGGAYLARQQGWRTWRKMQENLRRGIAPTGDLVDGILILAAGLLLVTPGILTDVIGLGLLFPPIRAAFKEYLRRKLEAHAHSTYIEIHTDRWP